MRARVRCVRWVTPLALLVALSPMAASGCGNGAIGVSDCKQIEEARCNAAAKCSGIQLTPPYYTNGSATDACIRFYDTACQHGLAGSLPGTGQLQACVAEIQDGGCSVVEAPWNQPACAWLIPISVVEASTDADGSDGDAGDGSDTSDGSEDGAGE
jgi:hypothetical protein